MRNEKSPCLRDGKSQRPRDSKSQRTRDSKSQRPRDNKSQCPRDRKSQRTRERRLNARGTASHNALGTASHNARGWTFTLIRTHLLQILDAKSLTVIFNANNAFDRVNHWTLAKKLLYRNVPRCILWSCSFGIENKSLWFDGVSHYPRHFDAQMGSGKETSCHHWCMSFIYRWPKPSPLQAY